jgi:hypothetical protein
VRSIVYRDGLYEQFESYDYSEQIFSKRFGEYIDTIWQDKDRFLHQISNLEDWHFDHIIKPLSLKTLAGIAYNFSLIFTAALGRIVLGTWSTADFLYGEFTGRPRRGDVVMGDTDDQSRKPGYWDGLEDEAWTASLIRKDESEKISFSKDMESMFAKWRSESTDAQVDAQPTMEAQPVMEDAA